MSTLIAGDVGNVNTKLRKCGGPWSVEPSLVRTPGTGGYSLTEEAGPRPIVYLEGPAKLPATPFLVGADAQRYGATDLAIVGSAEARVRSDAYLVLHLYLIVASLPAGATEAVVDFAGGLPAVDAGNRSVAEALRGRLNGLHRLTWGGVEYSITVRRTLFVSQPVAALATLMFDPSGRVLANGALKRKRFGLDIGGGTTDFTGRVGLDLIPGTEGGVRSGVFEAARRARELVQQRHPRLRNLSDGDVLAVLRDPAQSIYLEGTPLDVSAEIELGVRQASAGILAEVLPRWERHLEGGEVLLFGGGGERMAGSVSSELAALTRVTLLPDPIYRIAEGTERIARNRLTA